MPHRGSNRPKAWVPPPLPGVVGGAFHPDFMFCGDCTNCGNTNGVTRDEEEDDYNNNNDVIVDVDVEASNAAATTNDRTTTTTRALEEEEEEDDCSDDDGLLLHTRLILDSKDASWNDTGSNNRQHKLLLESLLRPMKGVRKVVVELNSTTTNSAESVITIDHDASCARQDFVRVLQQGGYPAQCPPSKDHDDDIDHNGVEKNDSANISTTDHATTTTTTTTTSSSSSSSNNNAAPCLVKSSFFVQGICCASEVPSIRKILRPLPGVRQLQINITTKRVYVQHEPTQITAADIAHELTRQGLPAHVIANGAATVHYHHAGTTTAGATPATDQQQLFLSQLIPSSYVESTLYIVNLTSRHAPILTKAIAQTFTKAKVRAIHPHVSSKTVKVEHDPSLVSCQFICTALEKYGLNATIVTDGAQANLRLPLSDDDDNNNNNNSNNNHQADAKEKARAQEQEWQSTQLSLHVLASGVFWIVALVSAIKGWETVEMFTGLASVVLGLPPVAFKALRTVRRCEFDANCMMVTAALGALALAEWEEAASVSFLFAISEYLEARATDKARTALAAICQLRPDFAHVLHPETGEIVVVPASRVPIGSLISVRTGDKIAADGIVVEGTSQIDESSLTGESVPIRKTVKDTVSGGGINIGSTQLVIRTTTSVDDSAVSRLIRLVEDAQANTSPTEKMVDGFARAYTPAVLSIAALMCTIPWFWGAQEGRHWTLNGLIIIVIACPCALTISTPVTYAAGLAATAQRGVIVKGGASLEALGSVKTVLLDKTGTLTEGKFKIMHLQEINTPRREMLELLALMEAPSSHPLSATLVQAAKNEGVANNKSKKQVREHTIIKGEGVAAFIDGKQVYVGNFRLFDRIRMYEHLPQTFKDRVREWNQTGGSVGFVGVEGTGIIGTFCVTDIVRPESKDVVEALLSNGIDVHMLTGDGEGAAYSVALQVGLTTERVHAKLLPEDKLHYVGSMKAPTSSARHKRYSYGLFRRAPRVLFCGDGVNDAPALAAADVGVSMGEGAALAMEMSDVTLMDSNLQKLVYVLNMGARVVQTIRENILMSLACKLVVVILTFLGYMTLLFAIASDVGVMLLVTLNGMRLLPGGGAGGDTDDTGGYHPFGCFGGGACCSFSRIAALPPWHVYQGVAPQSSDPTTLLRGGGGGGNTNHSADSRISTAEDDEDNRLI